jgi:hypothetical protein
MHLRSTSKQITTNINTRISNKHKTVITKYFRYVLNCFAFPSQLPYILIDVNCMFAVVVVGVAIITFTKVVIVTVKIAVVVVACRCCWCCCCWSRYHYICQISYCCCKSCCYCHVLLLLLLPPLQM